VYRGHRFDKNAVVLTPRQALDLPAIWCFCISDQFAEDVRQLDSKLYVTTSVFGDIPFDLAYWQTVAAERYPNGLPEPHSDDPTQWLFKGDIATSTDPLQVAVPASLATVGQTSLPDPTPWTVSRPPTASSVSPGCG